MILNLLEWAGQVLAVCFIVFCCFMAVDIALSFIVRGYRR